MPHNRRKRKYYRRYGRSNRSYDDCCDYSSDDCSSGSDYEFDCGGCIVRRPCGFNPYMCLPACTPIPQQIQQQIPQQQQQQQQRPLPTIPAARVNYVRQQGGPSINLPPEPEIDAQKILKKIMKRQDDVDKTVVDSVARVAFVAGTGMKAPHKDTIDILDRILASRNDDVEHMKLMYTRLMEELHGQLARYKQSLLELESALGECEAKLRVCTDTTESLRKEIAELRKQLNEARKPKPKYKISKEPPHIPQYTSHRPDDDPDAGGVGIKVTTLQIELDSLKRQNELLKKELDELRKKTKEGKDATAISDAEKAVKIRELEDELERLRRDNESSMDDKSAQIQALQDELAALKSSNASKTDALQEKIKSLELQITTLKAELQNAKALTVSQKTQHDTDLVRRADDQQALSQRISTLEADLRKALEDLGNEKSEGVKRHEKVRKEELLKQKKEHEDVIHKLNSLLDDIGTRLSNLYYSEITGSGDAHQLVVNMNNSDVLQKAADLRQALVHITNPSAMVIMGTQQNVQKELEAKAALQRQYDEMKKAFEASSKSIEELQQKNAASLEEIRQLTQQLEDHVQTQVSYFAQLAMALSTTGRHYDSIEFADLIYKARSKRRELMRLRRRISFYEDLVGQYNYLTVSLMKIFTVTDMLLTRNHSIPITQQETVRLQSTLDSIDRNFRVSVGNLRLIIEDYDRAQDEVARVNIMQRQLKRFFNTMIDGNADALASCRQYIRHLAVTDDDVTKTELMFVNLSEMIKGHIDLAKSLANAHVGMMSQQQQTRARAEVNRVRNNLTNFPVLQRRILTLAATANPTTLTLGNDDQTSISQVMGSWDATLTTVEDTPTPATTLEITELAAEDNILPEDVSQLVPADAMLQLVLPEVLPTGNQISSDAVTRVNTAADATNFEDLEIRFEVIVENLTKLREEYSSVSQAIRVLVKNANANGDPFFIMSNDQKNIACVVTTPQREVDWLCNKAKEAGSTEMDVIAKKIGDNAQSELKERFKMLNLFRTVEIKESPTFEPPDGLGNRFCSHPETIGSILTQNELYISKVIGLLDLTLKYCTVKNYTTVFALLGILRKFLSTDVQFTPMDFKKVTDHVTKYVNHKLASGVLPVSESMDRNYGYMLAMFRLKSELGNSYFETVRKSRDALGSFNFEALEYAMDKVKKWAEVDLEIAAKGGDTLMGDFQPPENPNPQNNNNNG